MRPYEGVTMDDDKKKPQIYKLYDFTKGGTDIVDQKMGYHTCKAMSRRWTMTAFYYILDTIRVNSTTIYTMLKPELSASKVRPIAIGYDLVLQLVKPHMARRASTGLRKSIIQKIRRYIPEVEIVDEEQDVITFLPKSSVDGK